MLVVDSSVILATVLPDETDQTAEAVLEQLEQGSLTACVPALFYLEVINVIAMATRRGRLTQPQAVEGVEAIRELPLLVDTAAYDPRIMEPVYRIMKEHRLTSYDAVYLELALRRNLPLATLDNALRAASGRVNLYYDTRSGSRIPAGDTPH